jgi:hypothetical protein
MTFNLRIALFTLLVLVAALASPANAQSPGPGWTPTGEWQCGPHVRIHLVDRRLRCGEL